VTASVRHAPKPLADPPTPTAADLVEAGRTGRLVLFLGAGLSIPSPSPGVAHSQPGDPIARAAATCSDYTSQAAAQQAADTRDADGDGIYCESLPCQCLKLGQSTNTPAPATPPKTTSRCTVLPAAGCRFCVAEQERARRRTDVEV
jgi:hypothetical protein